MPGGSLPYRRPISLQRFQLEATYLTLTSNLAGAAVQEASLRGQIAATEQIIKIERGFLDLIREQRKAGQVAELDVAAQEAALAQVEQTLPPLQKALAQQRDLLVALAGGFPSDYLGLLTAQQTYQQALLSLAQAKAARYADTVALFAALGGGWWNRQDVAPEKPLTIGDFFQ